MSTTKKEQEDLLSLETRKVKAIEKIANSLDALAVWVEEIDKDEWSERIQFYLSEFLKSSSNSDGQSLPSILDKKKDE
jgi:hypothetical protein